LYIQEPVGVEGVSFASSSSAAALSSSEYSSTAKLCLETTTKNLFFRSASVLLDQKKERYLGYCNISDSLQCNALLGKLGRSRFSSNLKEAHITDFTSE
jgi:hypothetical protein